MYNGIGLTTPRGSGTNGHVQKNWAFVRQGKKDNINYRTEEDLTKLEAIANRQPNQEILDHERKRKIEVKCAEFEEILEKQGYSLEEVQQKVEIYRSKLLNQGGTKKDIPRDEFGRVAVRETHQIAEAQHEKNARLREAFGISEYFVEGSSFDADRKAKEELAKSEALQNELEAQKEADRLSGKKYGLVRTPSKEKELAPDKDGNEKKKKKKKTRDGSTTASDRKKAKKSKKSKKHKKESKSKKKKRKRTPSESGTSDSDTDSESTGSGSDSSDDERGSVAEKKKKRKKDKKKKSAKKKRSDSDGSGNESTSERKKKKSLSEKYVRDSSVSRDRRKNSEPNNRRDKHRNHDGKKLDTKLSKHHSRSRSTSISLKRKYNNPSVDRGVVSPKRSRNHIRDEHSPEKNSRKNRRSLSRNIERTNRDNRKKSKTPKRKERRISRSPGKSLKRNVSVSPKRKSRRDKSPSSPLRKRKVKDELRQSRYRSPERSPEKPSKSTRYRSPSPRSSRRSRSASLSDRHVRKTRIINSPIRNKKSESLTPKQRSTSRSRRRSNSRNRRSPTPRHYRPSLQSPKWKYQRSRSISPRKSRSLSYRRRSPTPPPHPPPPRRRRTRSHERRYPSTSRSPVLHRRRSRSPVQRKKSLSPKSSRKSPLNSKLENRHSSRTTERDHYSPKSNLRQVISREQSRSSSKKKSTTPAVSQRNDRDRSEYKYTREDFLRSPEREVSNVKQKSPTPSTSEVNRKIPLLSKKRPPSQSSGSSDDDSSSLSYSPARRSPERYKEILEQKEREKHKNRKKSRARSRSSTKSPSRSPQRSSTIRSKKQRSVSPHEKSNRKSRVEQLKIQPIVRLQSSTDRDESFDSDTAKTYEDSENNEHQNEINILTALKSGLAEKAKKQIEKKKTSLEANTNFPKYNQKELKIAAIEPVIVAAQIQKTSSSSISSIVETLVPLPSSSSSILTMYNSKSSTELRSEYTNEHYVETKESKNHSGSSSNNRDKERDKHKIMIKPFKINENHSPKSRVTVDNIPKTTEGPIARSKSRGKSIEDNKKEITPRKSKSKSRGSSRGSRNYSSSSSSSGSSRSRSRSSESRTSSDSDRSSRSRTPSRSRSTPSRSPSIPRRRGSPSFLDRRRITSPERSRRKR